MVTAAAQVEPAVEGLARLAAVSVLQLAPRHWLRPAAGVQCVVPAAVLCRPRQKQLD